MRYRYFILPFFLIQLFISSSFAQLWYITHGLSTDDEAWAVAVDSAGFVYWAVEEKNQWPFWYFNIFLFKIDSTGHQIWQSAPYGGTYNELAYIANVHGNKVYLGGRTDTFGAVDSADALVVCYNTSDGSLNWDYRYDQGFGYEEVDGLLIQPDGIYFTGWTKGQTTDMDFLIQKINLSGQRVWSTSYDYNGLGKFDGANGHSVIDNTFIYVAGHVNRTHILSFDGDRDLFVSIVQPVHTNGM